MLGFLNGFKYHTVLFGVSMALIDVFVLGGLKAKSLGMLNGMWMLPLAMGVYALQPILFSKSLKFESLTVMNLFWDLSSDLLVTLVGLFYFAEKLSPRRMLGVGLSLIALMLLSCE
jgi:multidrug transporter EmrE-like cation transporter